MKFFVHAKIMAINSTVLMEGKLKGPMTVVFYLGPQKESLELPLHGTWLYQLFTTYILYKGQQADTKPHQK